MPINFLVYVGLNSNFLERVLSLNAPEHSTTIKIAKLGQKHITSLLSDKKRKKDYMQHEIESESTLYHIIHGQHSKATQLLSFNKTTNYF